MRPSWKTIAGMGILWAILMPLLLFYQEIADSGTEMGLDVMSQNMYSAAATKQGSDAVVELPAKGISNWAGVLHNLTATEERRSLVFLSFALISSLLIIILSVSVLKAQKKYGRIPSVQTEEKG